MNYQEIQEALGTLARLTEELENQYIIDEANLIAYWTPETRRATRLEKMPRRYYKFQEYKTA